MGILVVLVLLGAALLPQAAAQDCRARLLAASPASIGVQEWVDVQTPSDACTKKLDGFDASYQLVYSDEFNQKTRDFSVSAQDGKWTAEDLYYFPTNDTEVYKPEQVETQAGAAVITMQKIPGSQKGAVAITQQPDGTVWEVSKQYKSGLMTSWNKFCYTGGYVEASVQLPGLPTASGFWPAFWMMGNLGRAGYMRSTSGMWPYSYSSCEGSEKQAWSGLDAQLINACPDPPGVNRTEAWGMHPGQGRGAPEFDAYEIATTPGGAQPAHASQTLQMAPLMPEGVNWWEGSANGGLRYPGADVDPYFSRRNSWKGSLGRPGNQYQDSISALTDITESFYTGYHTWGVDWRPGQYLRWYVDGQLVYEVNQQALVAQTNGSGAFVGDRLIPLEPMYIILNLGMSENFGKIEYDRLPFPAQMKIDYVRVYQRSDSINVGCSPPDFPTAQFLACNRGRYIVRKEDEVLIKERCLSSISISGAEGIAGWRGRTLLGALLAAAAAALLL